MPESAHSLTSLQEEEDVRVAYQVVAQMIVLEAQSAWLATAVFVAVAGGLIVGSTSPIGDPEMNPALQLAIQFACSVLGLVVTLSTWSMIGRDKLHNRYWFAQARALEGRLVGIDTFRKGRLFAAGESVTVDGDPLRLPCLYRVTEHTHLYVLYILALVVFLALSLTNLVALARAGC